MNQVKKQPKVHSCPICRTGHEFCAGREIHDFSARAMKERALALVGLRPIRCVRCLEQFYASPSIITPRQSARVHSGSTHSTR